MVYRFKVVSEEAPNFRLEIQISSDSTFLQLRSALLDAAGYSRSRPDAFILCDEDWEQRELIALEDPGSDSETDVWLMDEIIMHRACCRALPPTARCACSWRCAK